MLTHHSLIGICLLSRVGHISICFRKMWIALSGKWLFISLPVYWFAGLYHFDFSSSLHIWESSLANIFLLACYLFFWLCWWLFQSVFVSLACKIWGAEFTWYFFYGFWVLCHGFKKASPTLMLSKNSPMVSPDSFIVFRFAFTSRIPLKCLLV